MELLVPPWGLFLLAAVFLAVGYIFGRLRGVRRVLELKQNLGELEEERNKWASFRAGELLAEIETREAAHPAEQSPTAETIDDLDPMSKANKQMTMLEQNQKLAQLGLPPLHKNAPGFGSVLFDLLGGLAGQELSQSTAFHEKILDEIAPVGKVSYERGLDKIAERVATMYPTPSGAAERARRDSLEANLKDLHTMRHGGDKPSPATPGDELRTRLAVVHDINEGKRKECERIDQDTESLLEPQRTMERQRRYRQVEIVAGEILRSRAGG